MWSIALVWSVAFPRGALLTQGTLRKHNPVRINRKESLLCQKWTYWWSRSAFLMKAWQASNWSDQGFSRAAGFHGDLQSNQQSSDLAEWRVWAVWHMVMSQAEGAYSLTQQGGKSVSQTERRCLIKTCIRNRVRVKKKLKYKVCVCSSIYWVFLAIHGSGFHHNNYIYIYMRVCIYIHIYVYIYIKSILIMFSPFTLSCLPTSADPFTLPN